MSFPGVKWPRAVPVAPPLTTSMVEYVSSGPSGLGLAQESPGHISISRVTWRLLMQLQVDIRPTRR